MPLSIEIAQRYKHNIFIETGTNNGLGVQTALDAGYQKVYSIEYYDKLYDICQQKFNGVDNVFLLHGDSGEKLNEILKEIDEPVTFWLDAHFSTSELYKTPLVDSCPILRELKSISLHHIHNHTILIDDIHYFKKGIKLWNNIVERDIHKILYEINADYQFTYCGDILIAEDNK